MWFIKICTAGWLGICGTIYDQPVSSKEECLKLQSIVIENKTAHWATCTYKELNDANPALHLPNN